MSTIKLGPWPAGLDNVSDAVRQVDKQTNTLASLRDAVDVTMDRDGWADSRPGRTLLSSTALHSMWTAADGTTYGGAGANLVRYTYPSTITTLLALPNTGPIAFTDGPSGPLATHAGVLYELRDGAWREAGLPDGSMFTVMPSASAGGLAAGQYAVAVAYVDDSGREGGLSTLHYVNVPEGGGIQLSAAAWPSGCDARVYRTKHEGDQLYLAATIPNGMLSYLIGAGQLGRLPMTQHLRRMVGGTHISYWRAGARLLTASSKVLRWSEAQSLHVWSQRHNWLMLPRTIYFLAPVEGGVWLGHAGGVVWLAGTRPSEWTVRGTSAAKPIPGTAVVVQASDLPFDLELNGVAAAVWLSERGYVVGTADGRLIETQAKRVRIAPASSACTLLHNNRLTAFIQ